MVLTNCEEHLVWNSYFLREIESDQAAIVVHKAFAFTITSSTFRFSNGRSSFHYCEHLFWVTWLFTWPSVILAITKPYKNIIFGNFEYCVSRKSKFYTKTQSHFKNILPPKYLASYVLYSFNFVRYVQSYWIFSFT